MRTKTLAAAMPFCGALAATILMTTPAAAHTFGAAGAGLGAGFVHPFLGLDHLLAMVAVGLWAGQQGGRSRWRVPATFAALMAAGAAIAGAGLAVPGVELGVAASVALFGALVVLATRLPTAAGPALVGLFALAHGHAHGAELPAAAAPLLYGLGFLSASLALQGLGLAAALAVRSSEGRAPGRLLRAAGGAIAVVGASFVLAAA